MPDPDSVIVMAAIDNLSKPMRDLVREFGHNVVLGMIEDGHNDADKLREELEAWRTKRQAEWLATDYFAKPEPPYEFHRAYDGSKFVTAKPSQELSLNELFPDLETL